MKNTNIALAHLLMTYRSLISAGNDAINNGRLVCSSHIEWSDDDVNLTRGLCLPKIVCSKVYEK